MHLNDYSKQGISRSAAWIAVGFVVLLLGGMGVVFMNTGHVPSIPRWVWIVELPLVVCGCIVRIWRVGLKATPRLQWLFPMGFMCLALSNIFPNWASASCLGFIGALMFTVAVVSPYIAFGKREQVEDTPPE